MTKRKLTKWDYVLIIVPIIGWAGNFAIRPHVMETACDVEHGGCDRSEVVWFDAGVIDYGTYAMGDHAHAAQNASGMLALTVPAAYSGAMVLTRAATPPAALAAVGVDFVLFLEATLWNGFVNETVRNISQRPRPFVYRDPDQFAGNLKNYTSFYSGHTSFSALSLTLVVLALVARRARLLTVVATGIAGLGIITATGTFRVLAGRHFISDVVVGAVAGIVIALVIAALHRSRGDSSVRTTEAASDDLRIDRD